MMIEFFMLKILQLPIFQLIGKLMLSLLLSGLMGAERERNDKPAGVRTCMLICFGATLLVLFITRFYESANLILKRADLLRPIAYYLVGWGFLGGGIINKSGRNKEIEGITTASLLLPLSIIGFLCGVGDYILAVIGTLYIYVILKIKYIQLKFKKPTKK